MNGKCVMTLPSPTQAVKAKRALQRDGIAAEVVKLTPGKSRNGCTSGVEIDCRDADAAGASLNNSRIKYGETMRN